MTNESSSERAYRELRDAILDGSLSRESKLTEAGLAKRLGTSRTPVREAVKRLTLEGLLERRKGQGLWASVPDTGEMQEIFDLRLRLESYAARLAALRVTKEQLEELDASVLRMQELVSRSEDDHSVELIGAIDAENSCFHSLVLKAAQSQRLRLLLQATVDISLVSRTFRRYSLEQRRRSVRLHGEIVSAIAARDPEWAERIMEVHILTAAASFQDSLRPQEVPPV